MRRKRRVIRTESQAAETQTLESRVLLTLNFQFDYRFDSNGFFDNDTAEGRARRTALERAATVFETHLDGRLDAIPAEFGEASWEQSFAHPQTGANTRVSESIPANVMVVYPGGRAFSGGVAGEANSGAVWNGPSDDRLPLLELLQHRGRGTRDTGPWGGSLSFDTSDREWFTGVDVSQKPDGESDLTSVAIHELGHLLGFLDFNLTESGNDQYGWPWQTRGGSFAGTEARAVHGGNVPIIAGAHWTNGLTSDGRQAAMTPTFTGSDRGIFTSVDWAAMEDLGWEVSAPPIFDVLANNQESITVQEDVGTFEATVSRSSFDNNRDGAVTVTLRSSDTGVLTVPATVTIPNGQESVTFDVTVREDADSDDENVTVTALIPNSSATGPDVLDVIVEDPAALAFEGLVASVGEAAGTINNVQIRRTGDTSAALTTTVRSNDITELSFAGSATRTVTFAAGSALSETFVIDVEDDTAVDGTRTVNMTVSATDFPTITQSVDVLDNDNIDPEITSDATATVNENQRSAIDVDATDGNGHSLTYAISGGPDAAIFGITPNTGIVTFNAAPDFEVPSDSDGNNTYIFTVEVTDGFGGSDSQNVTVTLANVNEQPVIVSSNTATVEEGQTGAIDVDATDEDGNPLTYAISGGDSALFSVVPGTGVITFNAAPDFEAPGDSNADNRYTFQVNVTDGEGGSDSQNVTVIVTDMNEDPEITSGTTATVNEAQAAAIHVNAIDVDGDTLTYTISGGDSALFSIVPGTGVVTFNTAPDFESPGDSNGDNAYQFTVQVSDGEGGSDSQAVTITVENVNERPVINSSNSQDVLDGQTSAIDVNATDPDGDNLTYSITGTDADLFNINANNGVVTFRSAPDFDAPGDANSDNVYEFRVTASDGSFDTNQDVEITVLLENQAPSIGSSATSSVAENQTSAIDVDATDPDGDTLTYSISGGADAGLFSIDPGTGVVSFTAAPDFEAPGDANSNNTYVFTVTASDGREADSQSITVTVVDENEAPTITSGSTSSVVEGQTSAIDVDATDVDGDSVIYSLSGTDADLFNINSNNGVVTFRNAPDFDSPGDSNGDNEYRIVVTANDGDLTTDQDLRVTVTEAPNNAPNISTPSGVTIDENSTVVVDVQATDADGDSITYLISGGADADLFTIDSDSGRLRFQDAPDFETPLDANQDNVYRVNVRAMDSEDATDQVNLSISVQDVQEATGSNVTVRTGRNNRSNITLEGNRQRNVLRLSTDAAGNIVLTGENGTFINGDSEPVVLVESGNTASRLTIRLGNGRDRLYIDDVDLGGARLEVRTGKGQDNVFITDTEIGGSLRTDNPKGADVIVVSGSNAGSIDHEGIGHFALGGSMVEGGFSFVTDDRNFDDVVQIQDSMIEGQLDIRTGRGRDVVSIDNLELTRNADIRTGDHDDVVSVNGSTFESRLQIETRDGNDRMILQNSEANRAVLRGGTADRDYVTDSQNTVRRRVRTTSIEQTVDIDDAGVIAALGAIDQLMVDFDSLGDLG